MVVLRRSLSELLAVCRGAGSAWRAMNRDRRLAVAVAVGLFASLWAPWYQETVIARGVIGLRTLSQAMTGWQALSGAGIVALIVACGVVALLFTRSRPGRAQVRGERATVIDGLLIAVGGALCALLLVIKLLDHGGATARGLAEATVSVRWGVILALLFALTLMWLGGRIARAHRVPSADRMRSREREPGGRAGSREREPGGRARSRERERRHRRRAAAD